jgi:hypothetical protein
MLGHHHHLGDHVNSLNDPLSSTSQTVPLQKPPIISELTRGFLFSSVHHGVIRSTTAHKVSQGPRVRGSQRHLSTGTKCVKCRVCCRHPIGRNPATNAPTKSRSASARRYPSQRNSRCLVISISGNIMPLYTGHFCIYSHAHL